MRKFSCICLLCFMTYVSVPGRAATVKYEFDIHYMDVNITGKRISAMVIDGKIPGPTIKANLGDTLQVTFNNDMDVETSIHWHGVLLPNDQDGVPYLTTPPIEPGTSLTFEYPVIHTGTYWYHAHTGLQEQRGIYGPVVFRELEQDYEYDTELVLVLSDWTDEDPHTVLRNLKREDDYYALKKDAVQSWYGVLTNGIQAIKNRINGALIRMGPMDVSDVGYDAFLINGMARQRNHEIKNGKRLRLRLINASASSYFNVAFSGGEMILIEADGIAVRERRLERLRLATAETYDVIVTIPDSKQYEFRATAEDGPGYASYYLGEGELVPVPHREKLNLYLVDHLSHRAGDENMSAHHAHKHHPGKRQKSMMEYNGLRSKKQTSFATDKKLSEMDLRLTGSMERYTWSFNDKALTEVDKIRIKKGEIVRFNLINETMMHHPIHLHGHFFRVLNGEGDYAPLKHTVNVPPLAKVVIEFDANEEKDWFFHCHNLYHMKTGMARVVSYQGIQEDDYKNSEFYQYQIKNEAPWYYFADASFQSQMVSGQWWAFDRRDGFEVEYDFDYKDEYDIEAVYERQLTRFLALFAGMNFERNEKATEETATGGINYLAPLLVESELRIDSKGDVRLELQSDLQLTNRFHFKWQWNTDEEYRLQLLYDINKKVSVTGGYDSDFNLGAGVELRF